MRRSVLASSARLVIPAIWLGLIIAIDLIEAPLKFQAPGITIPLGLGIGRLVFTAMNIVEGLLALALLAAIWRPRSSRATWLGYGAIAVIYLVKVAVIRPILNGETEAVLAGASAGGSLTHILYIAADGLLALALVWFVWHQSRLLFGSAPEVRA